jgi:hypothetical protein
MKIDNRLRRVVIVGGGTAGWMTAAALGRFLTKDGQTSVTLIESEAIGTVGVGESTIPQINIFNRMLGLDENEFVRKTKATFKLAIEFVDWKAIGHSYHHPFGPYGLDMEAVSFHAYWLKLNAMGEDDDLGAYSLQPWRRGRSKFMRPNGQANSPLGSIAYAFQFDAGLYAKFLRDYSEARGVARQEGKIASVQQNGLNGLRDLRDPRERPGDRGRPLHRLLGFPGPADRADPEGRLRGLVALAAQRPRRGHALRPGRLVGAGHPRHRPARRLAVAHPAAAPPGQRLRLSSAHISEDEATAFLLARTSTASPWPIRTCCASPPAAARRAGTRTSSPSACRPASWSRWRASRST